MGILNIDVNNIDLDYTNYKEDNPDTIILIILLAWHIKFETRNKLKIKISKKFMPMAWHTKRWWDWCMVEDEKKEIDPIFIEEL